MFYIILKVTFHFKLLQNIGFFLMLYNTSLSLGLNSLYLLLSHTYIAFPSQWYPLVCSLYLSLLLFCYIYWFVVFFRFLIEEISSFFSNIKEIVSFFVSDLFHLVQCSPCPHMLPQEARVCSFLWLSNIPLCIYTTSSLPVYLLMEKHYLFYIGSSKQPRNI